MPWKSRTTLKCIAKHLGISVSTVARVVSGRLRPYRISVHNEKTVLAEAERGGFARPPLSWGLRLKQTHTLGLTNPGPLF